MNDKPDQDVLAKQAKQQFDKDLAEHEKRVAAYNPLIDGLFTVLCPGLEVIKH